MYSATRHFNARYKTIRRRKVYHTGYCTEVLRTTYGIKGFHEWPAVMQRHLDKVTSSCAISYAFGFGLASEQ